MVFAKHDLNKLKKLADNFKWFNYHQDKLKKEFDKQDDTGEYQYYCFYHPLRVAVVIVD